MLVQLFRDNYTTTPTEYLISTIYTGFFDGVEGWFDTAPVVATDLRTSDLTDLTTISKNLFYSNVARSLKVTGFFRAKKTGTYRFFTSSNDKNILEIEGDDIIVNTDIFQTLYANKSLIEGRYYPFNLYYGSRIFEYPPVAMTGNTTNVAGQLYGNGAYTANASSNALNQGWNVFDKTGAQWRSGGFYPNPTGTTTLTGGTVINGEWVEIILPSAIILDKFMIEPSSTNSPRPRMIKLVGRNNNADNWDVIYEVDSVSFNMINVNPNKSFRQYRLVILSIISTASVNYTQVQELYLYEKPSLTCGYTEPNEDGTSTGSTNPNDFIKDATGLTTYYDINPDTQPTETSNAYPLLYLDNTLEGLFKVSILALYMNRTAFSTGRDNIMYLASDELFNNFNGTYKNYIQLHENPLANLLVTPNKRFNQFSSDMSFECELNGKIEVRLRRGTTEPIGWRYLMLILDVERLPVEKI